MYIAKNKLVRNFFLIFSFIIFCFGFVYVYKSIDKILIEQEYINITNSGDLLKKNIDAIQHLIIVSADDIAVWNEIVSFVNGTNPDFIQKHWPGTSPLQHRNLDFLIIKDNHGRSLYAEKSSKIIDESFELVNKRISQVIHSEKFIENHSVACSNILEHGQHGIIDINGNMMLISLMPIRDNYADNPVGTVIMGALLTMDFFVDYMKQSLYTVRLGDDIYDKNILSDYMIIDKDEGLLSFPIISVIDGRKKQIGISMPRIAYKKGLRYLEYTIAGIFVIVILYTISLYNTVIHIKKARDLKKVAYIDELTGLNNRVSYKKRIEHLLKAAPVPVGIAYVDLNNLKKINDSLGHEKGDEYIRSQANILLSCFRHNDIFRIGGDEFVILAESIPQNIFFDNINILHEKSGDTMAIGHIWCTDSRDIEQVIEAADGLMYDNKMHQKENIRNKE